MIKVGSKTTFFFVEQNTLEAEGGWGGVGSRHTQHQTLWEEKTNQTHSRSPKTCITLCVGSVMLI